MSIKTKFTACILLLIISSITITNVLTNIYIRKTLLALQTKDTETLIQKEIDTAQNYLSKFASLTQLTSQYPPVQGILRARATGTDPLDGSSLRSWEDRLQSIFRSQIQTFPQINQIRYLDKNGLELVRVNREGNNIVNVARKDLQNKSDRYYFSETMQMPKGKVYLSRLDLNVENGRITEPHVPTIRFGIPVFSETNNTLEGAVFINVNVQEMLSILDTNTLGEGFIINQDGYYLLHENMSLTFGHLLNTPHNYFHSQPEIAESMKTLDSRIYHDVGDKEFRVWKKFFYRPDFSDIYMVIIHRISEETILAPYTHIFKLVSIIIGICALITCLAAWKMASTISKPIVTLGRLASNIQKGKLEFSVPSELKKSEDEISSLAISMEAMAKELINNNERLDQHVKLKTQELIQKIDELNDMNRLMVGRELKMMELKKELDALKKNRRSSS